ncbi:MAG: sigma-70 family RNA polymerase sigma factor [bacterium]
MDNIAYALIQQAAQGDMEAFEHIYRQTSSFVYSLALRIIKNQDHAQDITQDVFIRIYKSLKSFGFKSSFKTWIYRITINTALNALAKLSKEEFKQGDYDIALETVQDTPHIEEDLHKEQNEKLITSLLDRLNPNQRICVILREIDDLSYEDIAHVLHVNINTVRSRLKRARTALLNLGKKEVACHEMY